MGFTNFTTPDDDGDGQDNAGNNQGNNPPSTGPLSNNQTPPNNQNILANTLANALTGNSINDDDNTDNIMELLIDYNEKFVSAEPALFRDALVRQSMAVLISKDKPNILLKGPAGVGKTRIVEELARLIATGSPLVPDQLAGYTVYELPVSTIMATGGIVGAIERTMQAVIAFFSDPDNKAICFIDEIHQITGGSSSHSDPIAGRISQILKPALARDDMRLIGATTANESTAFDEDPAFARRFSHLIVDELTFDQSLEILRSARDGFMTHYHHRVQVSDAVTENIAQIAETHSRAGQHRPDTALTLMDRAMASKVLDYTEALAKAQADNNQTGLQMLRAVSSLPLTYTGVMNVALRLATGNSQQPEFSIPELHAELLSRLQGQDTVLTELTGKLERHQLGLFPRKKPITWLLAGASGVGKTETAKIIAQHMTATEPIILGMAEYGTRWDANKILGAAPGYIGSDSNRELPFDSLESNPYRVILLDEFEKAHSSIHQLFLSAFDEGYMTDAKGKVLDFSKALVICTTNAARDTITKNKIGFMSQARALSHKELNKALAEYFAPELLGRFSLITSFNSLSESDYRDILRAEYDRQYARISHETPHLAQKLPAVIGDTDIKAMATATFDETIGARPAARAIQSYIEDLLMNPAKAAQAAQVAQDADTDADAMTGRHRADDPVTS